MDESTFISISLNIPACFVEMKEDTFTNYQMF